MKTTAENQEVESLIGREFVHFKGGHYQPGYSGPRFKLVREL